MKTEGYSGERKRCLKCGELLNIALFRSNSDFCYFCYPIKEGEKEVHIFSQPFDIDKIPDRIKWT